MATAHPNQLLGRPAGTLRPGDVADLVLFDFNPAIEGSLAVRSTILGGEVVFGEPPSE